MAEFLSMSEATEHFGSKGKTNAALTTGIIGTALGGLAALGGLGANSRGSYDQSNGLCSMPSIWSICEKQNEENVALTSAIWQSRVQTMTDIANVFERLNTRLVEVEKKDAALEASLPLALQLATVNAERYADNKVSAEREFQSGVNFMLQREIDKKINGTMGLPFSDLITGVPTMPNLQYCVTGCNCPSTSTPSTPSTAVVVGK